MATALTLALIPCLLAATVLIHYEILRLTGANLPRLRIRPRQRILVVIAACLAAHLLEVVLYAAVLAGLLHFPAFGSIEGAFARTVTDFLYFSATSYTTLGIGEIYPLGALRLIVGLESLNGLLLITWSASFCYLNMQADFHPEPSDPG
ncbi:MAG: potassium channel family protein [Pseudotabrizicola sp.]|uniref:potassium channel family protein n=1 Tax=Pseudotabrizicola sp. TaxID=2939647 RepID=UPI002718EC7E|nr:potassium channel family protein [Pseudotabrizicola sp.]MDO8882045.1 potassium channel family protein [Pseudotabrizicola sp.]MDP2080779.1 potassium channel family protein [Pseudotabrizicola sp.]MDZ7574635.1 potassium channel family protein [Pseudotabrizicola sp.]